MPPYVSKFQEISDSLLIDNILAIVKRDVPLAIPVLYPLIAAGASRLDDSVARATGLTVLHMDGFTTKPGADDLFTIAGDTQVYQVISATTLVGTDSDVTFQPGLKVAIPAGDGNEVVTFTTLPDFAERMVGIYFKQDYPSFAIDPQRNKTSDDGHFIAGEVSIDLYLAVSDIDAPTVTRKAMKYVRVLKSILRTATVADYTAGFPANTIFALDVQLSYEYGLIAKNAAGYEKPVSFELTLKFNER